MLVLLDLLSYDTYVVGAAVACDNCVGHTGQTEDSTLPPAWTEMVPCCWKLLGLAEGDDVGRV